MKKKDRYDFVISTLEKKFGVMDTELSYTSPFELLIATVLSAQCTDKRVNMVTPNLFRDYPTPEAMALAEPDVIFEYIRSVSYPNSKARYLVGIGKTLTERFAGEVPQSMEELTSLPGVGRKTANVVCAFAFGKQALAVDTHVFRVSRRIGLVPQKCSTPYAVEKELLKNIPSGKISLAHSWILLHGRYTCTARKPKCSKCELKEVCRWFEKNHATAEL
ncbi:MAG: endonuclease III [Bacteroidaceae bacterium]|nr:endonuclease III [Bacteroidaceae bacterium]MBQ7663848.1 endonuclease III [Bacteroidaceae bacterium]